MVSAKVEKHRSATRGLLSNARRMRHDPTDAEQKFWRAVRGRRFGGYKFKRQYPVCRYIVDFICLDKHLIVELDGGQHALQEGYDSERTAFLESQGFHVIRYWNDDFLSHMDDRLEEVLHALEEPPSPAGR